MIAKRSIYVLAVVTAFIFVQAFTTFIASEKRVTTDNYPPWSPSESGPETQSLVPVQNMSLQVRVPPGKEFYIYFDQESESLKAKRLPDETAGLPSEAINAIQKSPDWIKYDLTRTYATMSEQVIDPSTFNDYTAPAFADMNGDGAIDLIVGDISGELTLYENLDPALHYSEGYDSYVAAVFVKNDSFFPPSVQPGGSGYSHPTIGDLNGDNLLDIVIGGADGRVYAFENAGPLNNPTWVSRGMISVVNVGENAAPALGDLDGDGDLDLMVGSKSGWMYQSINRGQNPQAISDGDPSTTTTPSWSTTTLVDIGVPSYSSPTFADMDGDGKLDMAVGEGGGWVGLYRFVTGSWVRVSLVFSGVSANSRATPALVELNEDNLIDMVTGCEEGPLRYYANIGNSTSPDVMMWQSFQTNYDSINFNRYYADSNHVYLTHRNTTQRLIEYANIINNAPQEMVDEIAFSIAKANVASLLNPSTFPEVYFNNTDSLYFNSQFTTYAEIVDYDLGTPNQWSTVRYLVNESGVHQWYEYPKDIYYWWLVSLKGTDELATFIRPDLMFAGHEGARNQSQGGVFWRWSAFNLASPNWPPDQLVKYPKEELPPLLKDKLRNASVMWNNTKYNQPALYNDSGYFIRDVGGNVTRPWNLTDQAVEIVSHWVASTLALNAQEHNDGNRPRQPVRIQWEHNGNCGELSDLMWAGLRSSLVPARGVCGYGGDHCWAEFYDRGWHQIDQYWSASATIINNSENYHYGWDRDWSGLMTVRGDGFSINLIDNYHHPWNASNDARFPIENHGLIDRANVTVYVTDANGHPLDGVKVAVGDYRYFMSGWTSWGTQWTFTDADGKAYFTTSEARQNYNLSNPNAGDPFDDGIGITVIGKLGEGELGMTYTDRLTPSYGDAYNPRNAPMHYYNFTLGGSHPRPSLPISATVLPPKGIYTMNVSFNVVSASQHPAVAIGSQGWNEGPGYHDLEFDTGHHVTSFIVDEDNMKKYLGWNNFEALNISANTAGDNISFDIPAGQNWHFVISNPGTLETVQIVNISATLLRPPQTQYIITITPTMIGRRLMSLPLRPADTDIESVLSTISGSYDYVRWYDPEDTADHWKSYTPGRSYNMLKHLDETMGFWINFTTPCTWTITGYAAQSTAIHLSSGWNLVGYPSSVTTYSVADLKADIGLVGVQVRSFDPMSPPYNLWALPDAYLLKADEGYWIYVPQDCMWLVTG